jgi:hypothetical protein
MWEKNLCLFMKFVVWIEEKWDRLTVRPDAVDDSQGFSKAGHKGS